jgi:formate-dependent phosphoribosylglycinamide formyltransferase (GAR transformylase)
VSRVLLVATTTGYQIRSFGAAAERLGVELMLASDRCDHLDDPWRDGAIPVRLHDQEGSVRAVRDTLGTRPLAGVLAAGDRPAVLAAAVATALGLPGNPPEAAERSRNKLLARHALRAGQLPVPSFSLLPPGDDAAQAAAHTEYPAVVKPLALSGSRGVIRVDDRASCVRAIERVRRLLLAPDLTEERDPAHGYILIESFVPGREKAVEGILTDGQLQVLAMFDKPDPLDGPFFEETIYVTPSTEPPQVATAVTAAVGAAARALGLRHGAVHAECRVNDDAVYVLEVAPRPIGGLCSRALRFVTGVRDDVSLEEVLLRQAIGQDVSGVTREAAASGVMMIPIPRRGIYRGVSGVEAAGEIGGVEDVRITAKTDALIVPLPEGRSYLGFIFARAGEPSAVVMALRAAHDRLTFQIDREVPVVL